MAKNKPVNILKERPNLMNDKRMMILPAELVKKIEDNRGDMTQADFIEYLIDCHFKEDTKEQVAYATREELHSFEQDMKKLLRNFLDFFVSYGLELGKEPENAEFAEFTSKLKSLEKDLGADNNETKKATIKWK